MTESHTLLLDALKAYSANIEETDLKRIEKSFESLSGDDKEWLARVHAKLGINSSLAQSVRRGIAVNQDFLNRIVIDETSSNTADRSLASRVRILPWVAAREWGSEPDIAPERNLVYGAILDAIVNSGVSSGRVLVPGSGMGRLAFEIASLGFATVGVEFDQLKVAAGNLIRQTGMRGQTIPLQPYVLETCNRRSAAIDNTREIQVPDRMFEDLNIEFDSREFTEFAEANSENSFDVVVTCFFLDTTVDIASNVAMIKRLLKPSGYWINCGPLTFHYGSERSVAIPPRWRELNAEEVAQTIKSSGFRISEESEIEAEYLGNPRSLMSTKHKCMFFVASRS